MSWNQLFWIGLIVLIYAVLSIAWSRWPEKKRPEKRKPEVQLTPAQRERMLGAKQTRPDNRQAERRRDDDSGDDVVMWPAMSAGRSSGGRVADNSHDADHGNGDSGGDGGGD